jgi:hypothetical protein
LTIQRLEYETWHCKFIAWLRYFIISLDLIDLRPLCLEHIIQKVSTSHISKLIDDGPEPELKYDDFDVPFKK